MVLAPAEAYIAAVVLNEPLKQTKFPTFKSSKLVETFTDFDIYYIKMYLRVLGLDGAGTWGTRKWGAGAQGAEARVRGGTGAHIYSYCNEITQKTSKYWLNRKQNSQPFPTRILQNADIER